MERLNYLLNKINISKTEAKELNKLFHQYYGIKYGGCMCASNEREELQLKIKEYIQKN
jgi:hypothetical protein